MPYNFKKDFPTESDIQKMINFYKNKEGESKMLKQKIILVDKRDKNLGNKHHSFKIKKLINLIGGNDIKVGRYISEDTANDFLSNNVEVDIVEK